jgi:hypothetical protein
MSTVRGRESQAAQGVQEMRASGLLEVRQGDFGRIGKVRYLGGRGEEGGGRREEGAESEELMFISR